MAKNKVNPFFLNDTTDGSIKSNQSVTDALGKLYLLMKKSEEHDKLQRELKQDFSKEEEKEAEARNKEISKALGKITTPKGVIPSKPTEKKKKEPKKPKSILGEIKESVKNFVLKPEVIGFAAGAARSLTKDEEIPKTQTEPAKIERQQPEFVEMPTSPVEPSPVEPSPVAPSPVAPSPVAPSPVAPVKPITNFTPNYTRHNKITQAGKTTAEPVIPQAPIATPSATRSIVSTLPSGGYIPLAASTIASEEGFAKKAMLDQTEVAIGFGHDITKQEYQQGFIMAGNEKIPLKGNRGLDTTINKSQATKLLAVDIPKYESAAKKPLGSSWNKLTDKQKAVLISYAYNTGSTNSLVKAGLKDAIDSGDTKLAANIIREKGIKTGKKEGYLKVLDERRHREASLFEIGTPATIVTMNSDKGTQLTSASVQNKDMKNTQKSGTQFVMLNNVNNTILQPPNQNIAIVASSNRTESALELQQRG